MPVPVAWSAWLAGLFEKVRQGQAQSWQNVTAVQFITRRQRADLGRGCVDVDLHLGGINHPDESRPGLVVFLQLSGDLIGGVGKNTGLELSRD